MSEGDGPHADVFELCALGQAGEFPLVGKPEDGRPDGEVLRRHGAGRGRRLEEHAEKLRPLREIPDRQREPAAGREGARELCDRLLRAT
jgi:hypothetical protein